MMCWPGWCSPIVPLTSCSKATTRPSAEIEGSRAPPWIVPLTYVVVPAWRSRTKMLGLPSVSSSLRLLAVDSKAT